MRKMICIVTACVMMMTMFAGCGVLQKKLGMQKTENDELAPVSSVVMGEEEAKKLTDKVPIHLYFANEDNTKLKLEVRYIPISEAKKSPSNLATIIVKELIAGSKSGLKNTIPEGTELRSPVKIEAGVATVDFTKAFVDNHPGGKSAEQMTIFSVVNSLTELKDIQKVKFTIDGKAQKEFKGNFKFDAPFPRTTALISKEPAVPSSISTDKPAEKKDEKKDGTKGKGEDGSKAEETSGEVTADDEIIETDVDVIEVDEEEILE